MTKTKATTSKTSDSKLRTTQYAQAVVAHLIIASKKVRQACQRHLNDLKRQDTKSFPWVFDEEKGHRPVGYTERFCKPSQGDYDDLKLVDWQHFVIGSLYGWVHPKSGLRRFKEGLIYVGRKNGKALSVETPIDTPNGWTTMGELKVGDYVYGIDGKPTKVIATTEVMYDHECFKVTFEDGEEIIADADHLWTVFDELAQEFETVTTNYLHENKLLPLVPKVFSLYSKDFSNCFKRMTSIDSHESVPVRCIAVDAKDHLFLAGEKRTATHNTTLISGLSLYAASKDGENGARVFQLANSKEQARELFDECKAMVKASTLLERHFETTLQEIRYGRTNSKIMPLATDSKKLDGKNASFAVFDEIHEYKTYKLINVIKNSTGARSQPMIMYITTAGYQLDGPLMDYYDKGSDVLNGVIPDERTFYFMAELDPEDDINDPKNWIKANPSLGVTLKLETLIEEWESRQHIPAERNDFITKRLNRFVQSDEQSFIDFEIIKKNNKEIDLNLLKGKTAIGGFDLSQSEDFTSACLEFELEDGRVFVLSHSWIPSRKVEIDNEKIPSYDEWVKEGWLTIIKGDYVDYTYIYDWFVAKSKEYNIRKITYDPANAYRLVEDLKAYGFNCEVVRQGHLTLNAPLKDIKEMLLDGKVIFNNNRLFRWYLNNVKLVEDRNGNWMPTKQGRYRKIDGFAAWLNAHSETLKLMSVPQPTGKVEVISIKSLKGR